MSPRAEPEPLTLEEVRLISATRQTLRRASIERLCATVEKWRAEAVDAADAIAELERKAAESEAERDRLRAIAGRMREGIERLLEVAGARRDLVQALVDQGCSGEVVVWMNRDGRGLWLKDVAPALDLLNDTYGQRAVAECREAEEELRLLREVERTRNAYWSDVVDHPPEIRRRQSAAMDAAWEALATFRARQKEAARG